MSDRQQSAGAFAILTSRECDILHLLAEDITDREIADYLGIAPSTVKWYNRQIYNKLDVNNRRQAVQRAAVLGLLEGDNKAERPKHNLPVPLTPFVGRTTELDDLSRLVLQPLTRLVTVLAPGGMGKTRLALAAAELNLPQFVDGVYFVPLGPLTAAEQLVPTIADAIGLRLMPDGRRPQEQLFDYFRLKRALLLLDNAEHLLDGVSLVVDLLLAAPGLKVLTTSRERLNLLGETVYPLMGMDYPKEAVRGNLLDYGAVQLFITCAQRSSAQFIPEHETEIARICQLVEGMPLAIELAAAWIGAVPVEEIADEIARSADFLWTTMRNVPERLRSVRTVFEAARQRLTEDEQRAFSRLSVFRGGFTRQAAQALAETDTAVLSSLVNKALLWWDATRNRYALHELLRQYGEERLQAEQEDYARARDRHSQWYADYCQQMSATLRGPQLNYGLRAIESEFSNIVWGWRWAANQQRYDLIWKYLFATYYFAWLRNRLWDVEALFNQVTEGLLAHRDELQQDQLLGTLLGLQAWIHDTLHAGGRRQSLVEQSAELLDPLHIVHPRPITVIALSWIGFLLIGSRNLKDSGRLCQASIAFALKHNYRFELGLAYVIYGFGFSNSEDFQSAEPLFEQAEQIAQELQQPHLLGATSFYPGARHYAQGRYHEAKPIFAATIEIFKELGDWWNLRGMYAGYIEILLHEQDYATASAVLHELAELVYNAGSIDFMLTVLVLYTKFLSATGAKERAVEVGGYCLSGLSPMTRWSEAHLAPLRLLLSQLESELPADVYHAARKRGEQSQLEIIVKDLLG